MRDIAHRTGLRSEELFDSSAKLSLLHFLCERLVPGYTQAIADSLDEAELLSRSASLLAALGINGAEKIVQGQAAEQEQLAFFDMLTRLAEETQPGNAGMDNQLPEKDAQLLAVACSQLEPMLSTDLSLFNSSPGLQKIYSQNERSDEADELIRKLQSGQHTSTDVSAQAPAAKQLVCQVAAKDQLEKCLDSFITTSNQFSQMFQEELHPWVVSLDPATLHGIGSMSVEAQQKCHKMQQLLLAVRQVQSAHGELVLFKAGNGSESHNTSLPGVLHGVTAKHKDLQMQQQVLSSVRHRLSQSVTRQPQLADL